MALTPSSINEHMPLLRDLASHHPTVAEFGVDIGQSTTAFLMGQPPLLLSYDLGWRPELNEVLVGCAYHYQIGGDGPKGHRAKIGETVWNFTYDDTRTLTLPQPVDLLLIDSAHYHAQTHAELTRHHSMVRSHILLHDTVSFGTHGEGGEPGILGAIEDFQRSHPEWSIEAHYLTNNGLMILRRTP